MFDLSKSFEPKVAKRHYSVGIRKKVLCWIIKNIKIKEGVPVYCLHRWPVVDAHANWAKLLRVLCQKALLDFIVFFPGFSGPEIISFCFVKLSTFFFH